MSAFDLFKDALRDHGSTVKETGQDKAIAQCPAHDDHNPSLSISTRRDGKGIILKCHAGCTHHAVLAELNLTERDLFDDDGMREALNPSAAYRYAGGRVNTRIPKANGGKTFRQTGSQDKSLYGVEHLGDAKACYLCEGEKAVKAIREIGGTAVATGGAERSCDLGPLTGLEVTLIADRDSAGRKWSARLAKELRGVAKSVDIVQSAVDTPKADVVDHIAAGYDLAELVPAESGEPTTWEAIDLGPWLTGQRQSPQPTVGISRSDGQKVIYAGREHVVLGETESGKSWFALGCAAVEIRMGRDVLYIHYEEGDPASTIERLRELGVSPADIADHLRFVAPMRPARSGWLEALLDPPPALVIHDGVNEAMSLMGADIMAADGAATFRRTIIKPCLRVGAATLSCDHVPKNLEGRGRDAYGSVHKGNAIDGARIVLDNVEPFGRGLRGVSYVYVTKDRPGQLRAEGRSTKLPGKTFFGTLVVDASDEGPDFLTFWAPKDAADPVGPGDKLTVTSNELADLVYEVLAALPDRTVRSQRELFALMRTSGHPFREGAMRGAVDDLIVTGRLIEVPGKRGARGYRAVLTAARGSFNQPPSATAARTAAPIERGRGPQSGQECGPALGRSGPQSAAVEGNGIPLSSCRYCETPIADHMHSQIARGYCNAPPCLEAAQGVTA